MVKNPSADARDVGSIPGLGRFPGVGNGNPLQYSCLENPMDRGVWQTTVHRVTKSRTGLTHTRYDGHHADVKVVTQQAARKAFLSLWPQGTPQPPCCVDSSRTHHRPSRLISGFHAHMDSAGTNEAALI